MTERTVNDRRQWKAQTFDYDYFTGAAGRQCTVCLTDKQREILLGLTEPLAWSTRWWSSIGTAINSDVTEAFRDDLRRRIIMACCGDEMPIQFRYGSDGVLERSDDGGATFFDSPAYDPRVYSPQFPPLAGDDGSSKKCIAATGAAALIKEQVGDQLTDGMTRYTLKQLVEDWVGTMLESSNPFQALVTVITNQIFALVIATLRPALTTTVYEILKCIFYCRMGADATVNNAQWALIRSDITDQIGGIAGIFLEHLVYLLGTGGLTNLIRAGGAASGDCSECTACPNCVNDFVIYCSEGANLIRGDNYIQVDAVSSAIFGGYGIALTTNNADGCCYQVSKEIISGSGGNLVAWVACGTAVPACGAAFGSGGLTIDCDVPFNTIGYYGGVVPFTIKLTLSDTPCP